MVQAKIELTSSLSLTSRGRTFRKGQSETITNQADIAYYEKQPGFKVTRIATKKPETKVAPIVKPQPKVEENVETEEAPVAISKAKLNDMNKKKLVKWAAKHNILLIGEEKKSEMIEIIMTALEGNEE